MDDNRIPAERFEQFRAALQAIAETDKDRAAFLEVGSTKTIERMRRSLPSQLKPFIKAPALLRALLADIEREAA